MPVPNALEQIKALLDKLPNIAILDAVDDTALTGNRPLPVTLTLAEWRMLRTALQALRDEAGEADSPEDRFEHFVATAITKSPEPLRELGEYLGNVLDEDEFPRADRLLLQLATEYATRPAPAAEAAPQGGGTLVRRYHVRMVSDNHAWGYYLTPAEDGAYCKYSEVRQVLLAAQLAATPPSAPAVDEPMLQALQQAVGAAAAPLLTDAANEHAARLAVSFMQSHAPALIRRLSAPVPQEGVDEATVLQACSAYTIALNQYGSNLKTKSPHEVAMRAALEAVLAAGALPQKVTHQMVLAGNERVPVINGRPVLTYGQVQAIGEAMLAAAPAQGVR